MTFVSFGSDGQTLITAGQDNTIRLWDLAKGKEIRRFRRPNIRLPQGNGDLPLEDGIRRMVQGAMKVLASP